MKQIIRFFSLTFCLASFFSAHKQLSLLHDRLEVAVLPTEILSSRSNTANASYSAKGDIVNVLYGLSGNHAGFLEEFSVSLKSVLLNAPLDTDINIYIMADEDAYQALPKLFQKCQLETWETRHQVTIHTMNVKPWLETWQNRMVEFYRAKYDRNYSVWQSNRKHTVGAFFRLFANDVLPEGVENVVYIDSDVVVLANLQEIWNQIDPNVVFQWGVTQCSGFMLLCVPKLPTVWELAAQSPFAQISKEQRLGANDQVIFVAVNQSFPSSVGVLPPAWDVSVANEMWRYRHRLLTQRPQVGMLHFNGGGFHKQSAFVSHPFLSGPDVHQDTWGMANYYAHLSWTWARYWAASHIQPAQKGYPIKIETH